MEIKRQFKGEKEFRVLKHCLAKTMKILLATSVLADSRKVKRNPKPQENKFQPLLFLNNSQKHLVHSQVIQLIQMEEINRKLEDVLPVSLVGEATLVVVLSQKWNLRAVILPMRLTMPLNILKIQGNLPTVR
jgi:hypothetical protein